MLLTQSGSAFIPVVFVILAIALRMARVYARRTKRSPDFGVDQQRDPPSAGSNDVPDSYQRSMTTTASTYPPASASATTPPAAPAGTADAGEFGTPDFGPPLDFGPMPDTPAP